MFRGLESNPITRNIIGVGMHEKSRMKQKLKHDNSKKEYWIENCQNGISLVLQIKPNTPNPNIEFSSILHCKLIPSRFTKQPNSSK